MTKVKTTHYVGNKLKTICGIRISRNIVIVPDVCDVTCGRCGEILEKIIYDEKSMRHERYSKLKWRN